MKNNIMCPYMDKETKTCARHGCIYLPHQHCLTTDELKRRIKLVKKNKKIRKGKKK